MIRNDINAAKIAAMKSGDKETVGTLRLLQAAILNRDIEARTGGAPRDDDALVTEVLQKMIKQRRESADIYRKGNREDRAAVEEAEIETWEAHTYGKAPVHFSSKEECERAAGVIATIGVKTEVAPEWDD